MSQSIKQRLTDIICEFALADSDQVTTQASMGEICDEGWDELVPLIEEEFDLEFDEADVDRLGKGTFGALLKYVEDHIN